MFCPMWAPRKHLWGSDHRRQEMVEDVFVLCTPQPIAAPEQKAGPRHGAKDRIEVPRSLELGSSGSSAAWGGACPVERSGRLGGGLVWSQRSKKKFHGKLVP